METQRQIHRDIETWRHRNSEKRDMEKNGTQRHRDM
jgi:hypothetical protein